MSFVGDLVAKVKANPGKSALVAGAGVAAVIALPILAPFAAIGAVVAGTAAAYPAVVGAAAVGAGVYGGAKLLKKDDAEKKD